MGSKDIRNGILTLLILAIGVKALTLLAKGYIAGTAILPGLEGVTGSLDSVSDFFLIGICIIIIILLPFYFSKRSAEKKQSAQAQQVR